MANVDTIGIVLAAGDGAHVGGSKALLALEDAPDGGPGEPLVLAHVAKLAAGGCARVVGVVRADALSSLGVARGVRLVISAADDPAGSLALALKEVRGAPDEVVVITPVDVAPVGEGTIRRLVDAVAHGARAATPRFETRSGHPVACRRSVLDPYRGRAPFPALRDVLRGLGDGRVVVDVSDPRVVVDLDTPEDVVAFTGRPPRFVDSTR